MQSTSTDATSPVTEDTSRVDPEVASALQELFELEAAFEHGDAED